MNCLQPIALRTFTSEYIYIFPVRMILLHPVKNVHWMTEFVLERERDCCVCCVCSLDAAAMSPSPLGAMFHFVPLGALPFLSVCCLASFDAICIKNI